MLRDQLTVVIPTYNMAGTLPKAIETVRGQDDAPRIIVVVDGADREAEDTARSHSGVQVLVNTMRLGAPASRNAGLALVETDCVAFLDADDYVEGGLHQGMADALAAADMVISSMAREQPNGRRIFRSTSSIEPYLADPGALAVRWLSGSIFGTGALGWRTEFFRSIGGWDTSLRQGQDIDVGLRGILHAGRLAINPTGRAVYTDYDNPTRISKTMMSSVLDDHHRIIARALDGARNKPFEDDMRRAAGRRYYRLAGRCFFEGASREGRWALDQARGLGLQGHEGSLLHRVVCNLIGLENKQRGSRVIAPLKSRLGLLHRRA